MTKDKLFDSFCQKLIFSDKDITKTDVYVLQHNEPRIIDYSL